MFSFRFAAVLLLSSLLLESPALAHPKAIQVRFVDAETGYAVQPEDISIRRHDTGAEQHFPRGLIQKNGRATLKFECGSHTVGVVTPNHKPMFSHVEVTDGDVPYAIQFVLDPIVVPKEVSTEYVATLHRKDETVFVGYIVDDEGGPLENVLVRTEPSNRETSTDARGYFQIHVPLQTSAEAKTSPAKLIFQKHGFKSEEHQYLELWSGGDYIYRVSLKHGAGSVAVDERHPSRRDRYPLHAKDEARKQSESQSSVIDQSVATQSARSPGGGSGPVPQVASTTTSVRIPTNIRVLLNDGTGTNVSYISMQTYCQRSLNDEWIASWSNYGPGNSGTNSLNAGAVANRTYAIGYVNTPAASSYDICASTSCQVYDTDTSSSVNAAVNFTANYVMFQSGASRIGFKLTEYSSENNQLSMSCGDGYTAPTGGCLYDPVCTGEPEFGHGRGMCQWGTVKWATGLKFPSNDFSNTTQTNGQPIHDWIWICEHYHPDLILTKGSPLAIGDDVVVVGTSVAVRQCPGNTITNGTSCPTVTGSKAVGTTGTIIGGPQLITADTTNGGYTWWQIQWSDTNGWSVENYLERVSATPVAPTNLVATSIATNQINLTWGDASANEIGFYIERGACPDGPFSTVETFRAGITNYSDTNVVANTTYYYRLRAFNQTANSAYSNTNNATTPSSPPVLAVISNKTINEGSALSATNSATSSEGQAVLADFESYSGGTEVIFQDPRFSGSTSAFLSNSPNVSAVATTFPTGNSSTRAYNVNFAVTNTAVNPWVRLTSNNALNLPNPVIDFTKWIRFNIWTDKAIRVGLGCRESTNAACTPIGSNGGTSGGIEWVGVPSKNGSQPVPSRLVSASNWTTLTFNIPAEPVTNFASGNNILSTASGLGGLEHLALTPAAGNTTYNIYLDDFVVYTPNTLTYSLDVAPTGMTIDTNTGVISWTPTESQGPGTSNVTVRVTDSSVPPQSDTKSFTVTVNEVNAAPSLTVPPTQTVNEGIPMTATNTASDTDIPANTLSFSLASAPSGMTINTNTGVVTWTPTESQGPGSNYVSVRVTDNGSPALSTTNSFSVIVNEVNLPPTLTVPSNKTNAELTALSFTNTAIDPDVPANTLTFSLVSAPAGMTINTNTGVITWTPAEDQGPSTNPVTVRVTDNGSPSTNDTKSFTIFITETNSTPVLTAISNRTNLVGNTLTITNTATDGDIPTNTLTFSLDAAPTGMVVNASSGVLTWTPSAAQAGSNNVTVRVTDNGSPALFDTKSFMAIVESGNQPPVLADISDRTVHIGGTLTFTNSATDPETNLLTFSLLSGAPPDATIDATSGIFSWTTTNATIGGVSNITVRVTDDGAPALSDEETFSITIIAPIVIQSIFVSNNATATFAWNSAPGATYRARYKTNIAQTGWIDLTPDIVASGSTSARTENISAGTERYYRVTLLNY